MHHLVDSSVVDADKPLLRRVRHIHPPPVFQGRVDVNEFVDLMGDDRVIFGSDWPHIEDLPEPTDWPTELENLERESVVRIIGGNVAALNVRRVPQ